MKLHDTKDFSSLLFYFFIQEENMTQDLIRENVIRVLLNFPYQLRVILPLKFDGGHLYSLSRLTRGHQ